MSKYTTEVRYICENAAGEKDSVGYNDVDTVITKAIPKIFNFDFPIFDTEYKNVICSKMLRHYYTREIGFETVGLWKLKLETLLNEVMPYYNQLYKSELIKFNPLYDTDLHSTHIGDKNSELNKEENKTGISTGNRERTESGSSSNTVDNVESNNVAGTGRSDSYSTGLENSKNNVERQKTENGTTQGDKVNSENYVDNESDLNYDLYSDTPQGALTGVDQETYLTNARKVTDTKNKNGKKDDTEASNEKYNKAENGNESGENEKSTFDEDNVRNCYEENNDKTSVTNENRSNNTSVSDNDNRSDFANTVGKDKFNSTESYVLHVVGKQSGTSYSKLLKEFRETFLNIDLEVIKSLSGLFMNLW